MKSRRTRSFLKNLFTLFAIYALVVPLVFLLFDSSSFGKQFNKDPFDLVLRLLGIALGIAFVISFWIRKDPELRQW